ncbi:phage head morphogenesis protein [Acinetobacter sp. YIM 103518]|uniref:Phage head morphogenesis protein n=1 Tax=Acinetobacter faecalis TaxID=2665161 RepID=A0A6L6GBF1_9GAMM|nr:minor capsid protein [Acinetobacter faecalis]MTD09890.1 phage head morphogenesis protein [Acinetobacter faecalis]
MNTPQDAILSAVAQHSAYSYRLSSGEVNKLIALFNSQSNEMIKELQSLLNELSDAERVALSGGQYTTPLLKEIRGLFATWQTSLATVLPEAFAVSATALAVHEATFAVKLIGKKIKPDGEKLLKKAKKIPVVGGALVDELFDKIKDDVRLRVEYAIRQGITDGWTNQQIVQRIKGKKAFNYQDGILQQSRSDIDRVVRTSRSHVANVAYEDTYRALGVKKLIVCATLDGRTCIRCASLDGREFDIDDPKKPRFPEHPHSRTIYMPKVDNVSGVRPYVLDERKVKDIPKDQRKGIIGQVDSKTKFKDLLESNDSFAREWLGDKRYKLFKEGGYKIEKFIDPLGRQYSLAELKILDEKTFKELGL